MNYQAIVLHNEELNMIVDATLPNKAQNAAVKVLINQSCDKLMNRIAEGWLEDVKPLDVDKSTSVERTDAPLP